ncbi:hypothetical protein CEXT_332061 [Caerostris extrusa]|uniref:Uncharacterized protein n=1 Tax=Caerostris extrusa TaxID=172846 RepID=A0AAV4Q1L1_CAEEX|nr:hypothetical protein CEXT_332061 [Caerostris extrusa]
MNPIYRLYFWIVYRYIKSPLSLTCVETWRGTQEDGHVRCQNVNAFNCCRFFLPFLSNSSSFARRSGRNGVERKVATRFTGDTPKFKDTPGRNPKRMVRGLGKGALTICKRGHLSVPPECTTDKILNQAMKSRSRVRGMRLGNMELLNELAAYFEEKVLSTGIVSWIPTKYSKRKSQQVSESEARVSLRLSFLTSMKLQIRSDLYGKMRTIAIRDK